MAARYWVGGAGNWSSTTKWSTSSGGASGASVPTSVDDVIFDANSGGKFTATVDTAQTVNSITITPSSGAGLLQIELTATLTTGNLTTTGTAGNNRIWFRSTTYGISIDFVVNGTVSITDCDFRGIYVRGTSAPITGTRIGNRGECRGITFSTPKTVYWNLSGAQNWSANGWSDTSTGTPNTDFFPLPQDTATFTNAGSVTGTITLDTAIAYCPNVDMSGRTSAMTLGTSNATTVYGNWTNGSGTAFTGTATLTFSGGGTQTIDSAGKTFTCPITVNTYGGTVQLSGSSAANGALNIGSQTLTVTNGTFDTKNYNVTATSFSSNNSNVRTINLGSSTLSFTGSGGVLSINSTNLSFNAGTSNITFGSGGSFSPTVTGNITFYNVTLNITGSNSFAGNNTFNNLTVTAPASAGITILSFSANQTITGTLTCAGASAVRRIFLRSGTIGTQRTLTVNSISATDCDFRDINLAGTASGASPTRAGNCGGNSGITFPAAKTVYWNLSGAQNWSATGWCPTSGGTPDINQFPLAQDTAVFNEAASSVTGTITINTDWNIGTFDASARTSAMTLTGGSPLIYGDWKSGTGLTLSTTAPIFSKNGTQTITSNGIQFGGTVTINHPSANVVLADAMLISTSKSLTLTAGTFDAVTYNVTTGAFSSAATTTTKMGTGTWTLSDTGTVWTGAGTNVASTSTIVLSSTSTSARTFAGGGLYYNKLTIGGTTGTSTLTITGANTFGELASTKTVAHTITFPSSSTTTIGKWSVTGTVGNVVTLAPSTAATTYTLFIAGPANTGIDYLSVSYCAVSTTSPGEFYVGANSTNTAGNTGAIIFTATPAARTLYWVGGTGNWSSTTKWSTSSGGSSGAAIPTSLDAVNFDSASNATAYTATIDAGVTIARCAAFTMAGPLSGNVTFAGSVGIAFHGNVSFAATGITRTYTGAMQWAGNSSYTFDTNGLVLASTCTVIGIGSTWTLARNIDIGSSNIVIAYGTFSTSASNYAITANNFSSDNSNIRSISFNNSTITLSGNTPISFLTARNLTFTSGTSTLSCSATVPTFNGGSQTFYNVSFTNAATTSITITGANTFTNLTFTGRTSAGINAVTFNANQTITGTLTLPAGTAAAYRTFLASDTIGTQRTLTVNALAASATDFDFRDIAIAGAAAPISGTRFGDCKGNSGITFPAAKTVYYRNTGSANWGTTGTGSWSATSGGAADATQFPLAQDTAVFPAATYPASGSTTTVNANYNIGTIDMSLRTTNTMTLATGTTTPQIYGNWINGTGTTLTGTGAMTFAGRGSQTITSAGKTFTQPFTINTPSGSVTLQDAFTVSATGSPFTLTAGTFDASTYAFTTSGSGSSVGFASSNSNTRTLAIGSGTWTIAGSATAWNTSTSTNLTVTGTGTISLTSASAKTFAGGDISYTNITLNQGGAGALTITGNNTFKDITNTYSATGATTIALGNTTQTVTQFTGTGAVGKVLTISGTSATSPGTLVMSGAAKATTSDYLTISNVRAYSLVDTWYAGNNSTNSGSLGWYFVASGGTTYNVTVSDSARSSETVVSVLVTTGAVSESAQASDSVSSSFLFLGAITESAQGSDQFSSIVVISRAVSESAQVSDQFTVSASTFNASISDTVLSSDTMSVLGVFNASIIDLAQGSDVVVGNSAIQRNISEIGRIEPIIYAYPIYRTNIAEQSQGSNTVSSLRVLPGSITETASISDSVSAVEILYPVVQESARGSETVSTLGVFVSAVSDSASAQDTITVAASIFNAALSESVTGADSQAGFITFPTSVAESVQGSDTDVGFIVFPASISEGATGIDQFSAVLTLNPQVSESAQGSDLFVVAPSIFNAAVLENTLAQDIVQASLTAYASITESVRGNDVVSSRFLWEVIDDTQTPNWAAIGTTQTAGWVQVNDTQSAGWVEVNSTQTASWSGVDSTQNGNWVKIDTI